MTREPARPGGCLGAACLPAGDTSDPWGQSLRRSRNPGGGDKEGAVTPRPGRSPWPLLAAADERLRKTPSLPRASASGSLGPTFLCVNPGPGGPQTTLGLCLSSQIPGDRRGQGPA